MNPLRPHYTDYIYKKLPQQSLNIYAKEGSGRQRLLDDLELLAMADEYKVLRINMKSYRSSYAGFLEEFELTKSESDEKIFLDHFDAVLSNTMLGEGYDVNFFNQLNSFKNRADCSLLCITEEPYLHYRFYSEHINSLSPLELKSDKLTALQYLEIREELIQRQLGLDEDDFNYLLQIINKHSQPYKFLDHVCNRLNAHANPNLAFKKRLKVWDKELKNESRQGLFRLFDSFYNGVGCIKAEFGKLSKTIKALLTLLTAFVGLTTHFFETIIQYIFKIAGVFGVLLN